MRKIRFVIPQFTLSDIQLGVGDHEFKKGLTLYQKGSVNNIEDSFNGYTAIVSGTHEYIVCVDALSYDRGVCNCYVGQNDELCKHMIALAIALVYKYRPNEVEIIKHPLDQPVCSGEVRNITKEELEYFKLESKHAMTFIKSYNGPSSKWFQYQDSLTKGSRLILLALAKLPVCKDSVLLCIDILKKLDKKILRGVDDSDGTVGGLMEDIVEVLNMFVRDEPELEDYIKEKLPKGEAFDWETGFLVFHN